jgi:uncharacterized protein
VSAVGTWLEPRPTHLIYLHGFRSSPQSAKAQRVMAWLAQHHPALVTWCPQLPPSPRSALEQVATRLLQWQHATGQGLAERLVVMGSSLGGFYATHVANSTGCRAVLLNPAVNPARDLAAHIGEQRNWHGEERFFFEPTFVDELKAVTVAGNRWPHRLMPIIATGDEVIDWREMVGRYPGSPIRLVQGSNHALTDFDDHLDAAMHHLGLASSAYELPVQSG